MAAVGEALDQPPVALGGVSGIAAFALGLAQLVVVIANFFCPIGGVAGDGVQVGRLAVTPAIDRAVERIIAIKLRLYDEDLSILNITDLSLIHI